MSAPARPGHTRSPSACRATRQTDRPYRQKDRRCRPPAACDTSVVNADPTFSISSTQASSTARPGGTAETRSASPTPPIRLDCPPLRCTPDLLPGTPRSRGDGAGDQLSQRPAGNRIHQTPRHAHLITKMPPGQTIVRSAVLETESSRQNSLDFTPRIRSPLARVVTRSHPTFIKLVRTRSSVAASSAGLRDVGAQRVGGRMGVWVFAASSCGRGSSSSGSSARPRDTGAPWAPWRPRRVTAGWDKQSQTGRVVDRSRSLHEIVVSAAVAVLGRGRSSA